MSKRETYTVEIAGLTRHLPLFEVAPGVRIAIFNMLGDTYIVKAAAVFTEGNADWSHVVSLANLPVFIE